MGNFLRGEKSLGVGRDRISKGPRENMNQCLLTEIYVQIIIHACVMVWSVKTRIQPVCKCYVGLILECSEYSWLLKGHA